MQARLHHRVIAYKNKLFVFGGHNEEKIFYTLLKCAHQKLTSLSPAKIARCIFACCREPRLRFWRV